MPGAELPHGAVEAGAQSTPGSERAPLVVFATDAHSDAVLRETLLPEAGEGAMVKRGDIRFAIKALARGATPIVLVVDVSGIEQPFNALEELAQVVEPDVRVLVIGDREDAAFYRQLTRGMGILEYLYKPLVPDMVARFFGPYIRGGEATAADRQIRGGRVVTVTGVRGGAGASTVAANLAWHFAEDARRHTALLDADLHTGTAALLLNGRTSNGLRVALEHPDRLDELFVERAAQPIGERLHVLAGEERLTDYPAIKPGAAAKLLTVLRRRYNFVVIDVPGRPSPLMRELLELAHQRVLVLDPSLAAARETLRFAALPAGPTQARRAVTVLNRAGQPGGLTPVQLREALGEAPDFTIPWLPKVVPAAADLGEPAGAKRGPFRDLIQQLGQEVASTRAPDAAAARRGLLSRIFR